MFDLTMVKPIRHWSVSFQVWMHVLRDTIVSTFVSTMATRMTASVTQAMSCTRTRKHAHVRIFIFFLIVFVQCVSVTKSDVCLHYSLCENYSSTLLEFIYSTYMGFGIGCDAM